MSTKPGAAVITPTVLGRRKFRVRDPETGYERGIQVTKVRTPSGLVDSLYVDLDKDSCQVFAVTKDRSQAVLVRQWRPNTESSGLELPGGGLEPGEDPEEGARRELQEETGWVAGEVTLLMSPRYSPYSTGRRWSFLATGCAPARSGQDLDPNETLEVVTVPVETLVQTILQNPGSVRGDDVVLHGLAKLGALTVRVPVLG